MTHIHNADPAAGPVCTQFVTDAINLGWGITTRRTDKIVGTPVETRPGCKEVEAFIEAWGCGLVRICTREPGRTVPVFQSVESAAESFVWVQANRKVPVG